MNLLGYCARKFYRRLCFESHQRILGSFYVTIHIIENVHQLFILSSRSIYYEQCKKNIRFF